MVDTCFFFFLFLCYFFQQDLDVSVVSVIIVVAIIKDTKDRQGLTAYRQTRCLFVLLLCT